MKERALQREKVSRVLDANPRSSNRISIPEISQMKSKRNVIQLGKRQNNREIKKSGKEKVDPLLDSFRYFWEESGSHNIAGIPVIRAESYPKFVIKEVIYHITLSTATYHVSEENANRKKYFFRGTGKDITACRPEGKEGGSSSEMFGKLPSEVQTFIKENWSVLFTPPSLD